MTETKHSHPHPGELTTPDDPKAKEVHEKALRLHKASLQTITVKQDKDTVVLHPIAAVDRNGVAAPLYETDIARAKPGSDKYGFVYPSLHIQWAKNNPKEFLQWLGEATAVRWLNSKAKAVFQNLADEACSDLIVDGKPQYYMVKGKPTDEVKPDYTTFNLDEFLALAEDLSPRSETLAEINSALYSLAEEMSNLDIDTFLAKYSDQVQAITEFKNAQLTIRNQMISYKTAADKKRHHKATDLADGTEETPSTEPVAHN